MNKDSFLRYVEKTRDCEDALLDAAVNRGLRKAKNSVVRQPEGFSETGLSNKSNDRLDSRKFLLLAAACVFTAVMCFSVNLRPFTQAVEKYYRSQIAAMPGSGDALEGYIKGVANNAKRYLGGE